MLEEGNGNVIRVEVTCDYDPLPTDSLRDILRPILQFLQIPLSEFVVDRDVDVDDDNIKEFVKDLHCLQL